VASRGQQKSVVMLLKLAQCLWMCSRLGSPPVVIIDDLPSELDSGHREWALGLLAGLKAQVFVTAIDASQVSVQGWSKVKVFHVEHGELVAATQA
ncbi:MAG TPA: DNA replication and repair protein RecF, partial [Thioalkalivibrio sp.]|nr:DNA replication and repair protein RecF [Thioalkalivibrio sp.]